MGDFFKVLGQGLGILNQVQDNVEAALPDSSDLTEGRLVEAVNVSPGDSVDHELGRQALGAFVVKQSDATAPVLVTGLSSTSITVHGAFAENSLVSFWLF